MADELLSQEEINLLLQTLGKEEEKKVEVTEERIRPLDLSLFERISAGRIPGLELIFERWINGLRRALTSIVATIPTLFKEGVSIVRFGELIAKLPVPSAIGLFNIEPLRGTCLITIDPKLIYIVVSTVFGGGAKPYRIEGKDFTRIELKLIQRLLNACYQELEIAWNTVLEVKINPVGIETNPALLTIARSREKFILFRLVVVIEGSDGIIQLAIPEHAIAPYREILKGTTEAKTRDVEQNLLKQLQKVPINLEVVLGRTSISFKELLELKAGDVISLEKLLREPVEVRVEGIPKFEAFLGQVGSKKAVKMHRVLKKED